MGREKRRFQIAAHKKNTDKLEKNKPQRNKNTEKEENHSVIKVILLILLFLVVCLCFRSCRARDEPLPERIYEEDYISEYEYVLPSDENRRLNLALSGNYQISEEHPVFYIGYPEENIFDVVFTLMDSEGGLLYQTDFVAPGTNTAIDGTAFLQKGTHQIACLVSVYQCDSDTLVSDCTTVVLNIDYQ